MFLIDFLVEGGSINTGWLVCQDSGNLLSYPVETIFIPDTEFRFQSLADEVFPFRMDFFQQESFVVRHIGIVDGHLGEEDRLLFRCFLGRGDGGTYFLQCHEGRFRVTLLKINCGQRFDRIGIGDRIKLLFDVFIAVTIIGQYTAGNEQGFIG